MCEPLLPLPVQIFFWRQLRPFIRAKLGRIHEVSCMFCQHAPGHHEMKEACMSMEKVLVQNIYKELIPSLGKILSSVPRWHLIQGSLPFILHSTASLLNTRKDLQNLGPVETTLLYTLHWILLDAAEECADYQNELNNPFEYVFSISTIALFVYLFIPLSNNLKDIDFKDNLRLENGQKIWYPIYQNRHPDATCFMAECQTKSKEFWKTNIKTAKPKILNDSFIENKDGLHKRIIFSDQGLPLPIGVSNNDVSYCCSHVPLPSPKDKVFPETIPEESSSTEDEHVP